MFFKKIVVLYTLAIFIFSFPANAAVTFLPDYGEGKFTFDNINQDKQLCSRSMKDGQREFHHETKSEPKCRNNQIYDYHCLHGTDGVNWISKCHCPNSWVQCFSPEVGRGAGCIDDKDSKTYYSSCCNPSCSSGGSTSGCSGSEVVDGSYTNGCGDTCYTCRIKNTCNTSCYGDEDTIPTGGTNDDNGQSCVRCEPKVVTPDPEPGTPTTPDEGSGSDKCAGVSCSNNQQCNSSTGACYCPSGQCCPSCGKGYTCKSGRCEVLPPDDPCASVTCTGGKTCQNGKCVCPSGQCCPACSGSQTCDRGSCRDKTCSEKGMKDCNGRCISSSSCCSDSDCSSGQKCESNTCKAPACKFEDKCSGYTLSSDSSCSCHSNSCSACGTTKYKCRPSCQRGYTCDFSMGDCYIRPARIQKQANNSYCGKCVCDPGTCKLPSGAPCQCQIF